MAAHIRQEVILIQAFQRRVKLFFVVYFSEPAQIGVPLGETLVDLAALPDLVLDLPGFLVPIGVYCVRERR